jgi:hypothetical protein
VTISSAQNATLISEPAQKFRPAGQPYDQRGGFSFTG